MEEKFILRMDVPDKLCADSYFCYESDSIGDCLDALGLIYHESFEKDIPLDGCLFTIKGVKGTFRFNSLAWEAWVDHGGDYLFLGRCRVLESVEQRVEDILSTLKCGYKFERMPMLPGEEGDVCFMCAYPCPVNHYGMKFNFAMTVSVYTFEDGSKSIEYGCFQDLDDCSRGVLKESKNVARMKREAELNKVFREGGCTRGDMDMSRHRDVTYVNEIPCGWHCPHCGTFWID